jgi:DNA-binding response OmpR family regulator
MTESAGVDEAPDRWIRACGTPLLVIDPVVDGGQLRSGLAARGVNLEWVTSAVDGLIELGRAGPCAVIVSASVHDLPAEVVVSAIRRRSKASVIAGLPADAQVDAGPLVLAGARAIVRRPYRSEPIWTVLHELEPSVDAHLRLVVGPLELDAAAYTVRISGTRLPDPPLREFELLHALMTRAPDVVADDELVSALWGSSRADSRTHSLSVHVRRLRRRLAGAADVRRVRGRGYALTLE